MEPELGEDGGALRIILSSSRDTTQGLNLHYCAQSWIYIILRSIGSEWTCFLPSVHARSAVIILTHMFNTASPYFLQIVQPRKWTEAQEIDATRTGSTRRECLPAVQYLYFSPSLSASHYCLRDESIIIALRPCPATFPFRSAVYSKRFSAKTVSGSATNERNAAKSRLEHLFG